MLVFNDLITEVQKLSGDPTICTSSLIGTHPTVGQSVAFNFAGGVKINDVSSDPGSNFQNQIKITSLKWASFTPISATSQIGYLSVQANLQGSSSFVTTGGNIRSYPKPGVTPPGIMVMMSLDGSGNILNCGGGASNGTDRYVEFTIATSIHDQTNYTGVASFVPPFSDNQYYLICSTNGNSAGQNYGVFYTNVMFSSGFSWRYYQERGNFQAPVITVDCAAHHK